LLCVAPPPPRPLDLPLLHRYAYPRHPPSFPTRRSSDLDAPAVTEAHERGRDVDEQEDQVAHRHHPEDATRLAGDLDEAGLPADEDRKSTRLNSSHVKISYAVFCLKKKNNRSTAQANSQQ